MYDFVCNSTYDMNRNATLTLVHLSDTKPHTSTCLNVFFLNVKQYHHSDLIHFLQQSFPGIHVTMTHEVVMYTVIHCLYSNSTFTGHPIFVGITIYNTM